MRKNVAEKALFAEERNTESTVDIVVNKIKNLLIAKKLKPGDFLPTESELAESIGVGRGSIREAMKILSAFGVVKVVRGYGTYVATSANRKIFDPLVFSLIIMNTDSEELIQLREMIETGVINLIIQNASDEDISQLKAVQDEFESVFPRSDSAIEVLNELDLKFHRTMARITHNHLVENIYNFVIDIFAPTINGRHGFDVHRKMLAAILERDPVRAAEIEREHTETWRQTRRSL